MRIGKFIVIVALIVGGLAFSRWFALGRQAAALADTIKIEVLEGSVPGPESVIERVLDVARREGIGLARDQISVHMVNPEEISTGEALAAAQNMQGLAALMVVELDYTLARGPISRSFHQRIEKPFFDSDAGTDASSSYSGAPPPAARAVDPGVPARDVGSYRRDIGRAVSGQAE